MSTIVTREYKQKQKSKTQENIWTDIQADGAGFKVMCVTHPKNIRPLSSWGGEGQGGVTAFHFPYHVYTPPRTFVPVSLPTPTYFLALHLSGEGR